MDGGAGGIGIIALFFTFLAAYLAWQRNKYESFGWRVLYTIIAAYLGVFYLVYWWFTEYYYPSGIGYSA